MAENTQMEGTTIRPLDDVLKEVKGAVDNMRQSNQDWSQQNVKDLRWAFDQVSAKMNQAIYNDLDAALIHETCLKTVAVLIEMLARTK